jgi:hypothetical protein
MKRLWPILRGNPHMFMEIGEEWRSSFRPKIRILNMGILKLVFGSLAMLFWHLVFIGTCLTKGVYGSPGPHPAVIGFSDCL